MVLGVLGHCFPNLESKHLIARAPIPVQVLEGVAHCHQLLLVMGQDKLIFLARMIDIDLLLVIPVVLYISNVIIYLGESARSQLNFMNLNLFPEAYFL